MLMITEWCNIWERKQGKYSRWKDERGSERHV